MPVLGSGGGGSTNIPKFDVSQGLVAGSGDTRFDLISGFGSAGPNASSNSSSNVYLPGFNNDGDYIRWQNQNSTVNNAVFYYNSSGVLQWTVLETDINASCQGIAGICKVGSLIYMLGVVHATKTSYLATVNQAGTLTVLGSGTHTLANSYDTSTNMFSHLCKPTGSTNLQFIPEIDGIIEIDITNGAVLASSTNASNNMAGIVTPDKRPLGVSRLTSSGGMYISTARQATFANESEFVGTPFLSTVQTAYNTRLLDWDDTFYPFMGDTSSRYMAVKGYSKTYVETWCQDLLDVYGFTRGWQ